MSSDKRCKVYGCRFAAHHDTLAHECGKCLLELGLHELGHGRVECGNRVKLKALRTPMEMAAVRAAIRALGGTDGRCHVKMVGGMGCTWYARRNYPEGNISLFFMHSDSWGQYGAGSDDRPALEAFLRGYREIETHVMVKDV